MPYIPPDKPHDQFTSAERKAWLANYHATAPERQKQSDRFALVATISLGAGLLLPMLGIVLAMLFN